MWDDLGKFHNPHKELGKLPKKTYSKNMKKQASSQHKKLTGKKIYSKKDTAFDMYTTIEDFDFMEGVKGL